VEAATARPPGHNHRRSQGWSLRTCSSQTSYRLGISRVLGSTHSAWKHRADELSDTLKISMLLAHYFIKHYRAARVDRSLLCEGAESEPEASRRL